MHQHMQPRLRTTAFLITRRPSRWVTRRSIVGALLCQVGITAAAYGQGPTTGIGMVGSALQSAPRLGAGSLTGVGPTVSIPLGSWSALETSVVWYSRSTIEPENLQSLPNAAYHLLLPSTTLHATVIEGRTSLSALLGAGVMRYHFDTGDSVPNRVQLVPTMTLGLAIQARIGSHLAATLSARDWLTYVRENELVAPTSGRNLGHSVDIRLAVRLVFGRRNATMTHLADFPLTYAPDFRPINASMIQEDPTKTDDGRTHVHANNGDTVNLAVVPARTFAGQQAPGSVAHLVAVAPAVDYDESLLGTIYFGNDSSTLLATYRTLLDTIARYLQDHPTALLELRAFTDGSGVAHENVALSERRATAVKDLLVRLYSVASERITTVAMGVDFRASTSAAARRVEVGVRVPSTRTDRPSTRVGVRQGTPEPEPVSIPR